MKVSNNEVVNNAISELYLEGVNANLIAEGKFILLILIVIAGCCFASSCSKNESEVIGIVPEVPESHKDFKIIDFGDLSKFEMVVRGLTESSDPHYFQLGLIDGEWKPLNIQLQYDSENPKTIEAIIIDASLNRIGEDWLVIHPNSIRLNNGVEIDPQNFEGEKMGTYVMNLSDRSIRRADNAEKLIDCRVGMNNPVIENNVVFYADYSDLFIFSFNDLQAKELKFVEDPYMGETAYRQIFPAEGNKKWILRTIKSPSIYEGDVVESVRLLKGQTEFYPTMFQTWRFNCNVLAATTFLLMSNEFFDVNHGEWKFNTLVRIPIDDIINNDGEKLYITDDERKYETENWFMGCRYEAPSYLLLMGITGGLYKYYKDSGEIMYTGVTITDDFSLWNNYEHGNRIWSFIGPTARGNVTGYFLAGISEIWWLDPMSLENDRVLLSPEVSFFEPLHESELHLQTDFDRHQLYAVTKDADVVCIDLITGDVNEFVTAGELGVRSIFSVTLLN